LILSGAIPVESGRRRFFLKKVETTSDGNYLVAFHHKRSRPSREYSTPGNKTMNASLYIA